MIAQKNPGTTRPATTPSPTAQVTTTPRQWSSGAGRRGGRRTAGRPGANAQRVVGVARVAEQAQNPPRPHGRHLATRTGAATDHGPEGLRALVERDASM